MTEHSIGNDIESTKYCNYSALCITENTTEQVNMVYHGQFNDMVRLSGMHSSVIQHNIPSGKKLSWRDGSG